MARKLSTPTQLLSGTGGDNAGRTARGEPRFVSHRLDLDGLRGLAIGLVVLFHVWFGRVSGGVDVFLVLSGFFFGGSVLRAALSMQSSWSPVPQMVRLARRLLPALVVVLVVSALLTVLVQPETRWETFARQILASLGYYQNWELANTASDYLRAGETVSPLQHLWSMSVQGQFYLAFLVFVLAFAVLTRRLLGEHARTVFIMVLSGLTLASFAYASNAHIANQSTAYYDSFARAWEPLLGVLVGAAVPHVRCPLWLRALLGGTGLVVILACGAVINGADEFPGPLALVPAGATLLLILAAANTMADPLSRGRMPAPSRLLASKPFVKLGVMAYPLYLWHWPLLIFWLSYTGQTRATVFGGAGVLLISGVLAYLTHRFVENPMRYPSTPPEHTATPRWTRWRRPRTALGTVLAMLGVTLTVTSFTWREHVTESQVNGNVLAGLSARDYPGARVLINGARASKLPMRPSVLEARRDLPQTTTDGCISDFGNLALIKCTYGDIAATRTVALAGGSHAEHWITALDLLGRQHKFKVVTYLKMGCPLSTEPRPLIAGSNEPYPQCHQWVQVVMNQLVADRPDFVFTTTTRPRNGASGDEMPAAYLGIWDTFRQNNLPVLGMRDTPWLVRNGRPYAAADCLAENGDAISCGIKRSDVLDQTNPTLKIAARYPVIKPLDLTDALCRSDVCRAVEGNVLVYKDSHHLSATYVRTLTDELGRQIADATGWW